MRQVETSCIGFPDRTLATVVELGAIPGSWDPNLHYLVKVGEVTTAKAISRLRQSGVTNVTPLVPLGADVGAWERSVASSLDRIEIGDVLALDSARRHAEVLMRPSDHHHTVFLTNRCNSRCLMCSQPPTPQDDGWRVGEAMRLARQMHFSPTVLGFTGGEPLLLGDMLRTVLDSFHSVHPHTQLEVLTNGRLASNDTLAEKSLRGLGHHVSWMVPLYGHAPFLHDYVVQAKGAFDETIGGLLNLQRWSQHIQLRVVLIEPVLRYLPDLCDFIALNLPFVREVALMACEPVGYALVNAGECAVDLAAWKPQMRSAVRRLARAELRVILMNTPLCSIDEALWPYAHQSISDWKQTYAPACTRCSVREQCCGLFAWHARGWTPAPIRPIEVSLP